jgi:ADP-ribose pyrophosphatase YjhB (NUDIX family)
MAGQGPFLWLSKKGSPFGFYEVPPNGMCISAFLFVTSGEKILLGKYADSEEWERLAGLEPERRRAHGKGWTIPASQLKFGEEPRAAGKRIAEDILGLRGLAIRELPPESDSYTPARFPELGDHYDIWFLHEAESSEATEVKKPAWYAHLAFLDPRTLDAEDYSRSHKDVVDRWLIARTRSPR